MRALLRYHGGKMRLSPKLIAIFPPHRIYTEVFGGGASVLLQKPRVYSELYNDLDGEVVNVFRVLQNRRKAARLEELLRATPYAREEFELGYKAARSDIERARRTIIRSFMGFGSDSISRLKASRAGFNTRISSLVSSGGFRTSPRIIARASNLSSLMSTAFRSNANRSGTTPASDWRSYPDCLHYYVERLQGVTIENRNAFELLPAFDREDALHYLDPPYPISVRKTANGSTPEHRYRWEMNDDDHARLAALARTLQGAVIISSYPNPVYDELFAGWRKISWTGGQFCSANTNAQTRTETVWMNARAWAGTPRQLFDDFEAVSPEPRVASEEATA